MVTEREFYDWLRLHGVDVFSEAVAAVTITWDHRSVNPPGPVRMLVDTYQRRQGRIVVDQAREPVHVVREVELRTLPPALHESACG